MPTAPLDQQITFLSVADLERSSAFYSEILGLPLVLDQGDCRIFGVSASAFLGICRRQGIGDRAGVIVTLVTHDVDGWHERLTGAGVACVRPPIHNERYHLYQAFYRDPDGYLVEIQRFLDPEWRAAVSG